MVLALLRARMPYEAVMAMHEAEAYAWLVAHRNAEEPDEKPGMMKEHRIRRKKA